MTITICHCSWLGSNLQTTLIIIEEEDGFVLRQNYTAYTTVRCEISLKVAAGQLMSSVDTHNIPRKLQIIAGIFAVGPRKWKTII